MRPLMPPVQTPDNLFHDGNPLTGELGTIVDAEHLNNVQGAVRDAQSELITVLNAAGINVDPSKQNQLLTALKALLLSRSNPFGDIKSDGTVKTALENLGLGEGSALPVGVPVPWPSATPPTGWLKCNGAAFSAEEYPELAKAYPTNKLPDLRGEFIRGWDDGRNVDAGRALLSQQGDAMQKISGTVADNAMGASASGSGAMTITGEAGITYYASATPSSSYIYYRK
ncbi:TPA: phage tail protein, partial [Escherichia coli]